MPFIFLLQILHLPFKYANMTQKLLKMFPLLVSCSIPFEYIMEIMLQGIENRIRIEFVESDVPNTKNDMLFQIP